MFLKAKSDTYVARSRSGPSDLVVGAPKPDLIVFDLQIKTFSYVEAFGLQLNKRFCHLILQ